MSARNETENDIEEKREKPIDEKYGESRRWRRGAIVFSKAGRDKGLAMVVLEAEENYLLLADGKSRVLDRPKRKKIKHVQPTHEQIRMKPECGRDLQDADLRKQINEYLERR
ncbi:MAG: KOW domain-containing RNA-binding protein [Defluviitaleaceae bacterium]|nr:KOW domain-containing RNA-binding protein [Defluviitaleaceae bacterium]